MEHTIYQVQILCANGKWKEAFKTSVTSDLNYAKHQLQVSRLRSPEFKFRLAVATMSDWCECAEGEA